MRRDKYVQHWMIHSMLFFAVTVTPETVSVWAITVVVTLAMAIVIVAVLNQ